MTRTVHEHLLVHAADMGGWLSDAGLTADERVVILAAANEGLFRLDTTAHTRWVLTDFGWVRARDLGAQ